MHEDLQSRDTRPLSTGSTEPRAECGAGAACLRRVGVRQEPVWGPWSVRWRCLLRPAVSGPVLPAGPLLPTPVQVSLHLHLLPPSVRPSLDGLLLGGLPELHLHLPSLVPAQLRCCAGFGGHQPLGIQDQLGVVTGDQSGRVSETGRQGPALFSSPVWKPTAGGGLV